MATFHYRRGSEKKMTEAYAEYRILETLKTRGDILDNRFNVKYSPIPRIAEPGCVFLDPADVKSAWAFLSLVMTKLRTTIIDKQVREIDQYVDFHGWKEDEYGVHTHITGIKLRMEQGQLQQMLNGQWVTARKDRHKNPYWKEVTDWPANVVELMPSAVDWKGHPKDQYSKYVLDLGYMLTKGFTPTNNKLHTWCKHFDSTYYSENEDLAWEVASNDNYVIVWQPTQLTIWTKECKRDMTEPLPFDTVTSYHWMRSVMDHWHGWMGLDNSAASVKIKAGQLEADAAKGKIEQHGASKKLGGQNGCQHPATTVKVGNQRFCRECAVLAPNNTEKKFPQYKGLANITNYSAATIRPYLVDVYDQTIDISEWSSNYWNVVGQNHMAYACVFWGCNTTTISLRMRQGTPYTYAVQFPFPVYYKMVSAREMSEMHFNLERDEDTDIEIPANTMITKGTLQFTSTDHIYKGKNMYVFTTIQGCPNLGQNAVTTLPTYFNSCDNEMNSNETWAKGRTIYGWRVPTASFKEFMGPCGRNHDGSIGILKGHAPRNGKYFKLSREQALELYDTCRDGRVIDTKKLETVFWPKIKLIKGGVHEWYDGELYYNSWGAEIRYKGKSVEIRWNGAVYHNSMDNFHGIMEQAIKTNPRINNMPYHKINLTKTYELFSYMMGIDQMSDPSTGFAGVTPTKHRWCNHFGRKVYDNHDAWVIGHNTDWLVLWYDCQVTLWSKKCTAIVPSPGFKTVSGLAANRSVIGHDHCWPYHTTLENRWQRKEKDPKTLDEFMADAYKNGGKNTTRFPYPQWITDDDWPKLPEGLWEKWAPYFDKPTIIQDSHPIKIDGKYYANWNRMASGQSGSLHINWRKNEVTAYILPSKRSVTEYEYIQFPHDVWVLRNRNPLQATAIYLTELPGSIKLEAGKNYKWEALCKFKESGPEPTNESIVVCSTLTMDHLKRDGCLAVVDTSAYYTAKCMGRGKRFTDMKQFHIYETELNNITFVTENQVGCRAGLMQKAGKVVKVATGRL
nr:polyprotein [Alphaendornavirus sp.]